MDVINFIIAVVALVIAILAYRRTGGDMKSMKDQIDSLRETAAEALDKAEKAVRPQK